jgi:hypothetical protein
MFDDRTCFSKADVGTYQHTKKHEAIYNYAVDSSAPHSLVREPWLFIAMAIWLAEWFLYKIIFYKQLMQNKDLPPN